MLKPSATQLSHEDLFVQRYRLMLAWSRKLTNNNQQVAEDLLHDVFVQFTLARPDLGAIQNLDGYLYRMLRNRHLSGIRRAVRAPVDQLSSPEYDSAETRLRSIDPRDHLKVQDELYTICRYACARKQKSKAGSVLILRFFLGYYPAEIVQLSRSSRQAVDSWLKIARTEARSYLDDPARLAFLGRTAGEAAVTNTAGNHGDFLLELRSLIFSSNNSECSSSPGLREIYAAPAALGCEDLAHIVSCSACLDTANTLLGLPPLRDRYPTDTVGRDKGPPDGAGGIRGAGSDQINHWRNRSKEVYEHSPTRLSISVNGFTVATQTVSSETSEATFNLNLDERIGFVEVHSEQDILLLAMDVEPPPDGTPEQFSRIYLSEDRSLELDMNFASAWPALRVLYRDPALRATTGASVSPAAAKTNVENSAEDNLDAAVPGRSPEPRQPADTQALDARRSWLRPLLDLIPDGFWLRPSTITGGLALILIGVLLLIRLPVTAVSAATLLDKASASEKVLLAAPDAVVHRTLLMEARDVTRNVLLSQRKIDIWQSSTSISGQTSARRVYDEHDHILAGEFVDEHGSSQVCRPAAGARALNTSEDDARLMGREVWRIDFSAAGFTSLIQDTRSAAVTQDPKAYYISFNNEHGAAPRELVEAALILARPSLRAIQETIRVRQSGAILEYRFIENAFEQVKPTALSPGVFKVDPVFAQPESSLLTPGSGPAPAPGPSAHSAESVTASADLEVEVEFLLDQAKANMGEQVTLSRTPDDRLLVKGIVDTDSRKAKLLEALGSIAHNPAVKIEISTVDEMARRQKQEMNATTVQRLDIEASARIPVFEELRRHFLSQGISEDKIDDQVSRFSAKLLQESSEALRHAWALKRLTDQMSRSTGPGLSAEAHSKQIAMIREHVSACESAYKRLRRDLQPAFTAADGAPGADGSQEPVAVNSESDLARALGLLVTRASAADAAVRSAFTISSRGFESRAPSARFWKPILEAEALASSIARFARE